MAYAPNLFEVPVFSGTKRENVNTWIRQVELKFITYTDHRTLLSVKTGDHRNSRLTRWQLELMKYDIQIVYVPGDDMAVADGLSRLKSRPSYVLGHGPGDITLHALATDVANSTGAAGGIDSSGMKDTEDFLTEEQRITWRE